MAPTSSLGARFGVERSDADFCFVPPRYSFAVSDVSYFITFSVMFLAALVMSGMAARIKAQADNAAKLSLPRPPS